MGPLGHLAIGYLLFSSYVHGRYRRVPSGIEVLFIVLGTLLPDLIDKPLAWFGVGDGRQFAHSLFVALLFIGLVSIISIRWLGETDPVVAFGLSYLSHPLSDGLPSFIEGDFAGDLAEVSYWVWPLDFPTAAVADSALNTSITHAKAVIGNNLWMSDMMEVKTLLIFLEITVVLLAAALWLIDGKPGWN